MKAKSIALGNTYHITLGRNEVLGEVIAETENGWEVRLTASDKIIKVNNAERFIKKARMIATTQKVEETTANIEPEAFVATPVAEVEQIEAETPTIVETPQNENVATEQSKPEGLSAINAAHRVLLEIGTPLNVRQIAEAAIERGYCPNLKGKTPAATISSCLQREIRNKQAKSRFCKVGKGQFAAVECRTE
jgi:hypothetical protein